jgi:predicted PurR-regulated permease PerM
MGESRPVSFESSFSVDRRRIGWWLVAIALLGAVGLFFYSFVGTFVFGLFVYYGARPINRRIQRRVGSRDAAATITLLFIVLPTLALLGYTGFVAVREFTNAAGPGLANLLFERLPGNQQSIVGLLGNLPSLVNRIGQFSQIRQVLTGALGAFGTVSNALLHLTLALTFAFFLYRDGHRLQAWYRAEVGGRDTAAYSYLAGVDADLEVVYFGNVLTVVAVTIGSILVYNAYNFITPASISLPFPTLLAVLTGLATFIPLVVGKVVYVPVAGYLVWEAVRADASLLVYPIAFLVVAFLFLDLIPQSIVRPYISGQTMHNGAVLFAYILGAALFGWYGLFFGPLLLVLVVQFANVVLSDLLRGRPFSPAPTATTTLGTDPADARIDAVDASSPERAEATGPPDVDETDAGATGERDETNDTDSTDDPEGAEGPS